MKKKLLSIIVLCMIFVYSADAKGVKIFDLKSQYFSETLPKKDKKHYKEARYDTGDVIVTTDTRFNKGSYMFGIFTVDIKEPLKNWNLNIKKKNGTSREFSTIRITSDSGNSYFITYHSAGEDNIQINNKDFKVNNISNEKLTATISKEAEKVKFYINGKTFLKIDSKNFGNLVKVEVELNDNYYNDELFALDIYKVN